MLPERDVRYPETFRDLPHRTGPDQVVKLLTGKDLGHALFATILNFVMISRFEDKHV